ncbi:MAG: terminase small subunit, partial [Candidatus Hydrogenedentes bacterium]|nr:terminase small subunit [Candidatus Hydrogenedentota bacterium]
RMSDTTIRRKAQEVAASPKVAAEIERHYTDLRECNKVTAERVIEEIAAIALSDFTDYVEVAEGRYQVRQLGELTREQRAAIKSLRTVETPDGPRAEIELHDKLGALRQLAKSMGLDKSQSSTNAPQVSLCLNMGNGSPIHLVA